MPTPIDVNSKYYPYHANMALGNIPDCEPLSKFGAAPDFATGDGAVTVWDGANAAGIDQMVYQYSSTADIDSLSSSNAGDTQTVNVQGLDLNWDFVSQDITLTGQTRVALTTSLIRVFRMKNKGSTDLAGDLYCYVNGTTTGGVPDTAADVRAIILAGKNQTLMTVYSVANAKKFISRNIYASINGASKSSNYLIEFRVREFGEVFQVKFSNSISDTGNSFFNLEGDYGSVIPAKSDIEVRATTLATGVSGASISAGFGGVLINE